MAGKPAADGRLDPAYTLTYTWLTYKLRLRRGKVTLQENSRQLEETPLLAPKGPRTSVACPTPLDINYP